MRPSVRPTTIVQGACALALLLAAQTGTAHADPYPSMTKKSCDAIGGTYGKHGTTRTCTYRVVQQLVYISGSRTQSAPDADGTYYVLQVDETQTCDRTYRTVQLKNQEPETDEVVEEQSNCSGETIRDCYRLQLPDTTLDASKEVDVSECDARTLS
jgi:hypothetical protein